MHSINAEDEIGLNMFATNLAVQLLEVFQDLRHNSALRLEDEIGSNMVPLQLATKLLEQFFHIATDPDQLVELFLKVFRNLSDDFELTLIPLVPYEDEFDAYETLG